MAYFLPSYFQKRLLRYALGRLDFIDSDAIDLDNLGFTIGQRSVIELKNVGIKVSKLVERIDLPGAIQPRQASIRILRVTIPADLHTSGIEIEVDGVDVEVDIDQTRPQDEHIRQKSRGGRAPSHKDIANRPRIATTAIHDPGGSGRPGVDTSHIIPAPEDLAASFLEAAPEHDKKELQAAVESRSIYIQQSTASLEGSTYEHGIGAPEGFSLPGFVTNFFAGIADRLFISIKNIALKLSILLQSDRTVPDLLDFVLKVAEIELRSSKVTDERVDSFSPRRSIRMTGLEMLVACDGDLLANKSSVSSPRLSKSRSSTATFARGTGDRMYSPLQKWTSSSSSSAASSEHPELGMAIHESMLEHSQLFDPSLQYSGYASSSASPKLGRLSPILTRDDVNQSPSASRHVAGAQSARDDLAESRFFSHDEAESMYMSAMSARSSSERIPGAFDQPSDVSSMSSARMRTSSSTTLRARPHSMLPNESLSATTETAEYATSVAGVDGAAASRLGAPETDALGAQRCVKRIFQINEASLKLPTKPREQYAGDIDDSTVKKLPDHINQSPKTPRSPFFSSGSHTRNTSDMSVHGIPKEQPVQIKEFRSFEVSLGDIECIIDVAMCHVLLKAATQLSSILQSQARNDKISPQKADDLHFQGSIRSLVVSVMESVPEIVAAENQRMPTESTFSVLGADSSVLQLRILNVQTQLASLDRKVDQKVTIHRFGLYREADKIMNFSDPLNLQESLVSSTIVLQPDDIVVRRLENRVSIETRPLHVRLDLLVLDDVLSRSGGLSSLLDLGNSVASASTSKDRKPKVVPGTSRRRSVHFDDPSTKSRPDTEAERGLKLNARISASTIDLVGSESSIQIRSSAIKLIQRSSISSATATSVSVSGPIVHGSSSKDAINLKLSGLEVQFFDTPRDEDLDRLLQLLAPSSEQLEQNDDIMVDTLLRQRRKGAVLRLKIANVQLTTSGVEWTRRLTKLSEEISKLSSVTKYLPEDDRPGILVFAMVDKCTAHVELDKQFGPLILRINLFEGAQISVPSLMAIQASSITLTRGQNDSLIRELVPNMQASTIMGPPMLMCRFIPDEMEPTVKLKLSNASLEYSVPLLLAITQLTDSVQASLAADTKPHSPRTSEFSSAPSEASDLARKIKLSLHLNSSAITLRPLGSPACGMFLFTDASIGYSARHRITSANVDIRKASVMLIDDVTNIGRDGNGPDSKFYFDQTDQVQELMKIGYVPVGSISAAAADIKITEDETGRRQYVDVEFRNNLLFLETCADSTQTLIQVLSGLSPPTPPSKEEKYRTAVVPIEDMLASWTGNAFIVEKGPDLGLRVDQSDSTPTTSTVLKPHAKIELSQILEDEEDDRDDALMNDLYVSQVAEDVRDEMAESSVLSQSTHSSMGGGSVHIAPVNITAGDDQPLAGSIVMHNSLIDFRDGHFKQTTSIGGTAHRWDSSKNTYNMGNETSVQQSPLKVRVRDVHIIWNLFDGYDWQTTRDVISQAVRDVEDKAYAKQRRRESHRSAGPDEEDESVVGDVLFNSIYISIPTNRDPRDLTNAINMDVGDVASETGSNATSTTITAATSKRHSGPKFRPKKLKLGRSNSHKITFELEGLAVDFFAFPSGSGEVESSVDVRVRKLEVFDHVPTSSWKKFATYMHEAGEREVGTDMVHIEILNVKPIAELAASEIVLKATVLPLRLHVDQDALDFITRFFEFKDDKIAPSTSPSNPPFIQRAEVNPIKIRLDFKPKRVDYAGLKSGKLTEFMNFIILERSDMVLRRVILYGVSGFDRLGIMLNNIWTPDVRNNQLPGVLAGLAPVRSLVDVGSGIRDLIAVPIREYKKDGRIVRSIQKGALSFAKTTTTELVNLGAKLAIGTQTVLQNAEGVLAPHSRPQPNYSSDSDDEDHQKQISHYADQPLGIIQGLRGAYASLERDLLLAKDAIVAVPGEIMAEGSAAGAAKVVLKQSPTIILRPAIGVTKAMGQALLGAGNTLDKGNRKRIEDKYKSH